MSMLFGRKTSPTPDPHPEDFSRNGVSASDQSSLGGASLDALRSVPSSHADVIRQLESFVRTQLHWLKPVQSTWQPSDLLPNSSAATWYDEVRGLRKHAQGLTDDLLIVLVSDTITEEALPTYQTLLNRHEGLKDATGTDQNPWAQWSRGWTAEENRHGDLLNRYLYLSGRVDMRAVEITTQYLLRNGFDPHTQNDPYQGLTYTAFQERATRISHSNVARLAIKQGNYVLGRLCNVIAGDESRHEEAYKRFVGRIIELDPSGALVAIARMFRTKIAMPARLMSDGSESNVFDQFTAVAQRLGVYTTRDYAQIIEHLVAYWKIPSLAALSDEAAQAQEYLCGLAPHYLRLAQKLEHRLATQPQAPCRWIIDRVA